MQRGGQADPVGAFEGDRHGDHRDDLQAEAGRLAVSLGGEDGGSSQEDDGREDQGRAPDEGPLAGASWRGAQADGGTASGTSS